MRPRSRTAWIASHLGPRAAAVGLLLGGCTVADGDLLGTWEGTAKFDDGTNLEVRVEVLPMGRARTDIPGRHR